MTRDAMPLLVAAHGTRDPEGVAACRDLLERVRGRLPGVAVAVGFVELVDPPIDEALRALLAAPDAVGTDTGLDGDRLDGDRLDGDRLDDDEADADGVDTDGPAAAVIPLMLNGGGHVRGDIPSAIEHGLAAIPGARVAYGRPLGDDPRLRAVLQTRLIEAAGDWELRDITVVLLGRGAKVAEANAELARCARLLQEATGVAAVIPAFLQVTRPSLPEALGQAAALGARRVVVVPHLLLPGLLRTWTAQQASAWSATTPSVEVRVAEVIGACDELADIIADRYREVADDGLPATDDGAPVYLSGLRLQGRDVLVVGAGQVADRRIPRLLAAGARVRLVSPTISVRLRRLLATHPELHWEQRGFTELDVSGAWYVLAATNDPAVNALVTTAAESAHTFCVRADAAPLGSAWTPAVETAGGLTIAVVGNRDSRRSVTVRDALLAALHG